MTVPMRRKRQMLPDDETRAILLAGEYGVLGTAGTAADGYPYAVPLSYAYLPEPAPGAPAGRLCFHGALTGHRLDAVAEDPRVSFVVVGESSVAPERLTAVFRSAMAFGTARLAESDDERRAALEALGIKYYPGLEAKVAEEIEGALARTAVLVVDVAAVTGKEAIELTRARPHA